MKYAVHVNKTVMTFRVSFQLAAASSPQGKRKLLDGKDVKLRNVPTQIAN